eukprot:ctg_6036.g656
MGSRLVRRGGYLGAAALVVSRVAHRHRLPAQMRPFGERHRHEERIHVHVQHVTARGGQGV